MPLTYNKKASVALWTTVAAAFVGLAVVLVASAIMLGRYYTVVQTEKQLRSFADLTVDHSDRAIEDADKLLRALTPNLTAWDLRDAAVGRDIFNRMRRLMEGSPQIASVWVMDPSGLNVLDSWTYPAARLSAPERAYFQAALHGDPGPLIEPAASGSITNKLRFTISRAITGPDGKLHAVVVAGIYSGYFQRLYQQALTAPGMRATLLIDRGAGSAGGGVLAAVGAPESTAAFEQAQARLARSSQAGIGELSDASGPRIVAWRHSRQFSAIVAMASLPRSVALASWRLQSEELISIGVLALLAIAAAAFFLVRYRRSRAIAERNELLMREVQHRIRNNLQILQSLVRLRASSATEDETKDALNRMSGDLSAIADAFALLNRPGQSSGEIELTELLARLCVALETALGKPIRYKAEQQILLRADDAMNIAIVANELITNAVKHGGEAEISLLCESSKDNYAITVLGGTIHNEAVGSMSKGFGLVMANRLVASTGGKLAPVMGDTAVHGIEIRLPRQAPLAEKQTELAPT